MIYALSALVVLLAASTFYFWRNQPMDLLAKLNAATAAVDAAATKISVLSSDNGHLSDANAALATENAALKTNQADPALMQQIADGLDAITTKLA